MNSIKDVGLGTGAGMDSAFTPQNINIRTRVRTEERVVFVCRLIEFGKVCDEQGSNVTRI